MKEFKRYIKSFLFKKDGSVSIFAISIILPIFIFNAIFIDAIRVMTAERQIENAVEAAIRSAMSNYDTSVAQHGLFVTDDSAITTFNEVMNKQLYSSDELSGFNNLSQINITSSSANFQPQTDILQKEVFEYQVNESMKYQAPIQMAGEFAEFLKLAKSDNSAVEEIENVEKFVENFEEIMDLVKKRNDLLKDYTKRVEHLERDTTKKYTDDIIGKETSGPADEIPENIQANMSDLTKYFPEYVKLVKQENEDDEDKELSKEEKEKQEEESKKSKKEIDYYEKARSKFNGEGIKNSIKLIGTYETAKEDIPKAVFGDGGTSKNPKKNSAMYYNQEAKKLIGDDSELSELKKLILEDSFFTSIESSFEEMDKLFKTESTNYKGITDFTTARNYGLYVQGSIFSLTTVFDTGADTQLPKVSKTSTEALIKDINVEIKKLTDAWKKFEASLKVYNEKNKDGKDMEDAEEEQESKLGDLFDKINSITDTANLIGSDQETYNTLLNYTEKYKGASSDGEFILENSKKDLFTQAFSKLKELYSLFTDPKQIRSEIYMNEYAKANFSMEKPYELTDPHSYSYDSKALLYVIYGHYIPGTNYVHFLMEVIAIMLALNIIDSIYKNPLSKVGWVGVALAIGIAILDTINDLNNFINESYEFKFFKGKTKRVIVTPKTFASILFSLRTIDSGFNANKRIRILSGISEKTSVDFTETGNTILTGKATAEVKLLFLPQLFPGEVSGNSKTFDVSKYYNY